MKKIAFLLCAAAMLGTMTSCHRATDETPNVSPVVVDKSRTLFVTTNTAADITYEGKTVRNTTRAVFEQTAAQGRLKITPCSSQYYDQDEMAIDFYDKLTLAIDVQLVKKSSIEVSQEDAKNGQTVINDLENQNATGTVATISVSPTTDITGNTTDPFCITTFVPAETVLESTEKGDEVEANVLVIRCNPDGAKFSKPVDVTLSIDNSTGFDISCVLEDGSESLSMTDLGNDQWQVSIPHFSDWYNILNAIVTETSVGEEVTTGTCTIVAGQNTVSYKVKSGAIETTALSCVLVSTFIDKKFGVYFESTKDATFTSDAGGTATWRVTQPYKDVTLTSNIKVFQARVYDEPIFEIIDTQSGQDGHSGGSID
ncbi:MAG: hypothetical protein IKM77_10620 [Prevotella sp.]|nr:hypothetical protein [Prevotella sp.]